MGCIRCIKLHYIEYTFVKECFKINISLYLLPNILPLNLIRPIHILNSFSINEFAWIKCKV